jgi:DNA invertase Pin-like site-specific DNA recombinase
MQLGYARVSKEEQHLALQLDDLHRAGCERILEDTITGTSADRPSLTRVLEELRPGDTLVVWRLDRLGRSLRHLIDLITTLDERGIGFQSTTEQIDTTTSGGKLIFHIFGVLAEFERNLIRERTIAGLAAARARGKLGGRPRKLATDGKVQLARTLYHQKQRPIVDICQTLGISRATLYRYVKDGKEPEHDAGMREVSRL